MNNIIILLGVTIAAFIATNIDDLFVLMLFFSDKGTKRHVVIGQYIGFAAIIIVSLLGYAGTLVFPETWIGLLGFAPIGIGIWKFTTLNIKEAQTTVRSSRLFSSIMQPQTYGVAAVTFANGSDNLSVYIPLFASHTALEVMLMISLFFMLVGAWCYVAYKLVRHPLAAKAIDKYGKRTMPFILIGLGLFIVYEHHTIPWLLSLL